MTIMALKDVVSKGLKEVADDQSMGAVEDDITIPEKLDFLNFDDEPGEKLTPGQLKSPAYPLGKIDFMSEGEIKSNLYETEDIWTAEKVYEGLAKPTAKALVKVPASIFSSLALFPVAGIASLLELLPGISTDPEKGLFESGSLDEAMKTYNQVMSIPSHLITTPEEAKALEWIGHAMKPIEMAGEGWRLIGKGIEAGLKELGMPVGYIEPLLGTMGEAAAIFSIPHVIKALKGNFDALPVMERGLIIESMARQYRDGVPLETIVEYWGNQGRALRALGPDSPQWKAFRESLRKTPSEAQNYSKVKNYAKAKTREAAVERTLKNKKSSPPKPASDKKPLDQSPEYTFVSKKGNYYEKIGDTWFDKDGNAVTHAHRIKAIEKGKSKVESAVVSERPIPVRPPEPEIMPEPDTATVEDASPEVKEILAREHVDADLESIAAIEKRFGRKIDKISDKEIEEYFETLYTTPERLTSDFRVKDPARNLLDLKSSKPFDKIDNADSLVRKIEIVTNNWIDGDNSIKMDAVRELTSKLAEDLQIWATGSESPAGHFHGMGPVEIENMNEYFKRLNKWVQSAVQEGSFGKSSEVSDIVRKSRMFRAGILPEEELPIPKEAPTAPEPIDLGLSEKDLAALEALPEEGELPKEGGLPPHIQERISDQIVDIDQLKIKRSKPLEPEILDDLVESVDQSKIKRSERKEVPYKEVRSELFEVWDKLDEVVPEQQIGKLKRKRKFTVRVTNLEPGEPAKIPATWHDAAFRYTMLRHADGTLEHGAAGSYDTVLSEGHAARAGEGVLEPGTTAYIIDLGPYDVRTVLIYRASGAPMRDAKPVREKVEAPGALVEAPKTTKAKAPQLKPPEEHALTENQVNELGLIKEGFKATYEGTEGNQHVFKMPDGSEVRVSEIDALKFTEAVYGKGEGGSTEFYSGFPLSAAGRMMGAMYRKMTGKDKFKPASNAIVTPPPDYIADVKQMGMQAIRARRAELDLGAYDTNKLTTEIEAGTNKNQREVIPFIIENTSIPDKLNRPKLQKILERDKEKLQPFADKAKQHYLRKWEQMKEWWPELTAKQQMDYVTHMYDIPKHRRAEAASWFSTQIKYLKRRYIDTYAEAIDKGFIPKDLDIVEIIRGYDAVVNRAMANSRFIDNLMAMKADGMSLIDRGEDAPADWIEVDYPALTRRVPLTRSEKKKRKGEFAKHVPVKVHPDLVKPLKVVFEERIDHPVISALEIANGLMKKGTLSLSLFHHGALMEVGVAMGIPKKTLNTYFNPVKIYKALVRGEFDVFSKEPIAKDSIAHGVQYGATADVPVAKVQKMLNDLVRISENTPLANKVTKLLAGMNSVWDKALWNYIHDSLKLYAYEAKVSRLPANLNPVELTMHKHEIANLVNNTFGGLQMDLLGITPKTVQIMSWALLSSDWTLATTRQALGATGFGSVYEETRPYLRKQSFGYLGRAAIYFVLGLNALNAFNRKMDMKENPQYYENREYSPLDYTMFWGNTVGKRTKLFMGRYDDGSERYMKWGKQFWDFIELFTKWETKIFGKASPMLQLLPQLGAGTTLTGYKNDDIYGTKGWKRALGIVKTVAKSAVPISIKRYLREGLDFKKLDVVMQSSRGMSRYKAVEYMKAAILDNDEELLYDAYFGAIRNNLPAFSLVNDAISQIDMELSYELIKADNSVEELRAKQAMTDDPREKARYGRLIGREEEERAELREGSTLYRSALNKLMALQYMTPEPEPEASNIPRLPSAVGSAR